MQFCGTGGFQSGAWTSPQLGGLVVVLAAVLETGVDVEHQAFIVAEFEHPLPPDPAFLEDRTFGDGIVHVFLLEASVAHEPFTTAQQFDGVTFRPGGSPVLADCIDGTGIYGVAVCHLLQHAVLADEVAHHDEASFLTAKTTEKGFLHPFCHLSHTRLATAHLVIVKVIHHDIVRTLVAKTQSSW